jgi:hypothetical protein
MSAKAKMKALLAVTAEIKRLEDDLLDLKKIRQEAADELAVLTFKNVAIGNRHSSTEERTRYTGDTWNMGLVKKMVTDTFEVVDIRGSMVYGNSLRLQVMAKKVNKDGSLSKAENASSLTARPDEWRTVLVDLSKA